MIAHTTNVTGAQCLQFCEDAPYAEIDSESFEIEVGLSSVQMLAGFG